MAKLVREDESFVVRGAAMEVYARMGVGFLEVSSKCPPTNGSLYIYM